MSVDFYAVTDAWPTMAAMQQCFAERGYPVQLKRFPVPRANAAVSDGILAIVDNEEAYLQGSLYPPAQRLKGSEAADRADDVAMINDGLRDAGAETLSVGPQHYVLSVHIGGRAAELWATTYLLSGLINCFKGFAWEPQGNSYGRSEFAEQMLGQLRVMKEHLK